MITNKQLGGAVSAVWDGCSRDHRLTEKAVAIMTTAALTNPMPENPIFIEIPHGAIYGGKSVRAVWIQRVYDDSAACTNGQKQAVRCASGVYTTLSQLPGPNGTTLYTAPKLPGALGASVSACVPK